MKYYTEESLLDLRKLMQAQLLRWMPGHDKLMTQEMDIYDEILSRRGFLKTTLFASVVAFLQGCGSSVGPPSTWLGGSLDGTSAVTTVDDITAHADIMKVTHSDVEIDAEQVYDCLIEGFNPVMMSQDEDLNFNPAGFKPYTRAYGEPEMVHMNTQITLEGETKSISGFNLIIYEYDETGEHGTKETLIATTNAKDSAITTGDTPIVNTGFADYNTVCAANSSYHNTVDSYIAISQKMIAVGCIGAGGFFPDLGFTFGIFYQTRALTSQVATTNINAGTENEWQMLDILPLLYKYILSEPMVNILEIKDYNDGMGNSFIYASIQIFDDDTKDSSVYGCVVNFPTARSTEPTVNFFLPDEYASGTQNTLDKLDTKNYPPAVSQLYKPLAMRMDEYGRPTSNILFTYATYNSTTPLSVADFDTGGSNGDAYVRLLFNVDSSITSTEVQIVAKDCIPNITKIDDKYTIEYANLSSDNGWNGNASNFDLWERLYNRDATTLQSLFVKEFTASFGNSVTIKFVSDFSDSSKIGVNEHKLTFDIQTTTATSTIDTHYYNNPLMSYAQSIFSLADNTDYMTLWYNNFKEYFDNKSLHEVEYDFYCTTNHQGLLRNTFLFKSPNGVDSNLLVVFDEKGYLANTTDSYAVSKGATYHYNVNDVTGKDTECMIPVPISLGVEKIFPWYRELHDNEIITSAMKQTTVNSTTRELSYDNIDTSKKSYFYNVRDSVSGKWQQHTYKIKPATEITTIENVKMVNCHQVELQTINCYDNNIADPNTTIEIYLNGKGYVVDQTDPAKVKTYALSRLQCCYLKPNSLGQLKLEMHVGHEEDQVPGLLFFYRAISLNNTTIVHKNSLPILVLNDAATKGYKSFNLSYQPHGRLQTKDPTSVISVDTPQPYSGQSSTPQQQLQANNSAFSTATLKTGTDVYSAALKNFAPKNSDPLADITDINTTSKIKPLTYNPNIKLVTTSELLGDWWDDVKHYYHHAIHNIKKIAKRIYNAAKNALNTIVSAIASLLKDIASDVMTALVDAALCLDSLVKDVVSFVKFCIKFIGALLDFTNAYKIGMNLQSITDSFLSPTGPSNNIYHTIKSVEDTIATDINNSLNTLKADITSDIDSAFGEVKDDTVSSQTKTRKAQNKKTDTTKTNHIHNQLHRQTSKVTPADPTTSPTVKTALDTLKNKLENQVETTIKNVGSDIESAVTTLATGGSFSTVKTKLANATSSIITEPITLLEDVMDTVVHLPTDILDDIYGPNKPGSNIFAALEGVLLDALSLLFFQTTGKFKSFSDIVYFLLGFGVQVLEEIIGSLESLFGDNNSSGNSIRTITGNSSFASDIVKLYLSQNTDSEVITSIDGTDLIICLDTVFFVSGFFQTEFQVGVIITDGQAFGTLAAITMLLRGGLDIIRLLCENKSGNVFNGLLLLTAGLLIGSMALLINSKGIAIISSVLSFIGRVYQFIGFKNNEHGEIFAIYGLLRMIFILLIRIDKDSLTLLGIGEIGALIFNGLGTYEAYELDKVAYEKNGILNYCPLLET
ncbi:MAG: hypothetical protein GQ570_04330 [Helicobacteraceae bacterium]|nr:hypothetical protein [Helicobacteraceae bacterium]